jgi:hypothetical protein
MPIAAALLAAASDVHTRVGASDTVPTLEQLASQQSSAYTDMHGWHAPALCWPTTYQIRLAMRPPMSMPMSA